MTTVHQEPERDRLVYLEEQLRLCRVAVVSHLDAQVWDNDMTTLEIVRQLVMQYRADKGELTYRREANKAQTEWKRQGSCEHCENLISRSAWGAAKWAVIGIGLGALWFYLSRVLV